MATPPLPDVPVPLVEPPLPDVVIPPLAFEVESPPPPAPLWVLLPFPLLGLVLPPAPDDELAPGTPSGEQADNSTDAVAMIQ